jgi:hypothetical protein
VRLRLGCDHAIVVRVKPQAQVVAVRDVAVRKLRDVTVAVALAATAGMGLIAWVSAETIPGTAPSGPTGSTSTAVDEQPTLNDGGGFVQKQPRYSFGPGVAVSGGSR